MSREGRGLVTTIFKNFINSLKPKQFRGELVGKDYYGNSYYQIESGHGKLSRYYVPHEGDESRFDEGLPAEWEAWLRYRRKIPPTDEEIQKNLAIMKSTIDNAKKIDKKFNVTKEEKTTVRASTFPKYDDYETYPGKKTGENT